MLIATLLLALAGCSTSSGGLDWESDAFKQRMAQVRDNGLANESARVSVEVAVDDGSMQAMVELALKHNPEIKAGRLRVERMREKPAQASALDDPVFSLTAGELAQTAAGQVDYIVGLTQALPFPGTLDARKAVAEQAVLTASAELLDRMERVAADVRRVYWRRYAVAQAIEVTKQDKQVLQQVSQIIDAKAKVGDAEQADQLRVSLRLAALDQELDRLEQQMRSLDSMMNRLLNRSSDATLPWPTETEWKPQDIDRKEAIAQAERNNPAVQVQRRRVEGYRQQFNLAKAERKPDFRVGLQYAAVGSDGIAGSANGDDQFAVTGAISIPLNSDKYDAREREALRGIGETLADLDAAQGKAANLAEDALARMDAEVSILNRLKKQMLPDSRRTFELALTGYRAGKVSFIQMMDDWQRTLDLELAAHRAQARYEQARADLSAALGEVAADASEERDDE
ncbi:MAG: TolC family protein [Phycisphaeraceae bacterium]